MPSFIARESLDILERQFVYVTIQNEYELKLHRDAFALSWPRVPQVGDSFIVRKPARFVPHG